MLTGNNVRGLTTAASLWSTSALGILFGVGFYTLAIVGSAATLVVLAAASVTDKMFPQRRLARLKIRYQRQTSPGRDEFIDRIESFGFPTFAVSQTVESDTVEFRITLNSAKRGQTQNLLTNLENDQTIAGYEYIPHDN